MLLPHVLRHCNVNHSCVSGGNWSLCVSWVEIMQQAVLWLASLIAVVHRGGEGGGLLCLAAIVWPGLTHLKEVRGSSLCWPMPLGCVCVCEQDDVVKSSVYFFWWEIGGCSSSSGRRRPLSWTLQHRTSVCTLC